MIFGGIAFVACVLYLEVGDGGMVWVADDY
jgi:hypothetical protein